MELVLYQPATFELREDEINVDKTLQKWMMILICPSLGRIFNLQQPLKTSV